MGSPVHYISLFDFNSLQKINKDKKKMYSLKQLSTDSQISINL